MKKTLIILVCFCFAPAFADSHFPQCEISGETVITKTACYGTYTSATGHKYVGEFKNGRRHGLCTPSRSIQ